LFKQCHHFTYHLFCLLMFAKLSFTSLIQIFLLGYQSIRNAHKTRWALRASLRRFLPFTCFSLCYRYHFIGQTLQGDDVARAPPLWSYSNNRANQHVLFA
jgi:hypothetical protein